MTARSDPVNKGVLRVVGVAGSPYTRKLLAVLRYRRLPYRNIVRGGQEDVQLAKPQGPALLPNLVFEDGEALSDTTPIIARLETQCNPGVRSVYPSHRGLAFLNTLLEDYADEWHTKHMFHYRWWFKDDIAKASRILPMFQSYNHDEPTYNAMEKYIADRQVARVSAVTGSNEITAPVIEESYRTILKLLDQHFEAGNRFLFGNRPSSADFAFYGQFTCLALMDPTPMKIADDIAPRVVGFTYFLEDASGCAVTEDDWRCTISPTLKAILREAGRLYAPFMVANKDAVDKSMKEVNTVLDGKPFKANAFPYQAKCLRWLREDYVSLDAQARSFVDKAIAGTGLELMIAGTVTSRL